MGHRHQEMTLDLHSCRNYEDSVYTCYMSSMRRSDLALSSDVLAVTDSYKL